MMKRKISPRDEEGDMFYRQVNKYKRQLETTKIGAGGLVQVGMG